MRHRAVAVDAAGRRRLVNVCLETRAVPEPPKPPPAEAATRYGLAEPMAVHDDGLTWAFPCDPAMPQLADAAWPAAVRQGLAWDGPVPLRVRPQPLRYRPRRRAVFRYTLRYHGDHPTRDLYAKVLRTVAARRLRTIAADLPSPGRRRWVTRGGPEVRFSLPLGELDANTPLFEPMPGTPLGRLLVRGDPLPRPARIAGLLDELSRLGGAIADRPAPRHSRPPVETAERTAGLLRVVAPDCADDAAAVVEAVRVGAASTGPDPVVVHGDLYEGQIFVDDDFSLGLIDLEEMGLGDPALDAANCTAHLLAVALVAPAARGRILAYRRLLRQTLLERLGITRQMFAWREALVMLQLATGPFRTLAPDWPARVCRSVRIARQLADAAT